MTPKCLMKLKKVVSEVVYEQLDDALKKGDQKTWDITMQESHADMKLLKRNAIIDAEIDKGITKYVDQQRAKGIDEATALSDLMSGGGVRQTTGTISIDRYAEGVRGQYISELHELIHATRPVTLGLRRAANDDYIDGIIKGIFKDSDAVIPKGGQAMIDAWHQVTKKLLNRFNKAGGSITELEKFYIPTNHDSVKVLKAGDKVWKQFIRENFTLRRKVDKVAEIKKGKALKAGKPWEETVLSDDEVFDIMFKNITTEGAAKFEAEGFEGFSRSLGNTHQQFRNLQPKNGKSWLAYQRKFGRHANPIDGMKEYIDNMATDIAVMETLGTNPRKMIENRVAKLRATTGKKRAGAIALASFDQISPKHPHANDRISQVISGLKAFQTITKLPLAGITSLTDAAYGAVRMVYNGANPARYVFRQIKNLATQKDYKTASRLGLLAEYALHKSIGAGRYVDNIGYSALERVADFSTRISGLNAVTTSGKAVFPLEMLANLSHQSSKNFGALRKGTRRMLERYGFNEADWKMMQKAKTTINGEDFIDPMSDTLEDSFKAKLVGMLREETNFAIPEPNAKSRAVGSFGTQRNTFANEALGLASQFKTFGISVFLSNYGMMMDKSLTLGTRMSYLTQLATATTIMGMVVLNLKDVAKGREPRGLSLKFAAEGAAQGGLGGPATDIFFSDPDLFGGTSAFMVGPTLGDFQRIKEVTHGTMKEAFKVGGDWQGELFPAMLQAGEEMAFPLKLWQTRVASERLFLDGARRMVDPDYYSRLKRTRKWMRKERNQGYLSTPK